MKLFSTTEIKSLIYTLCNGSGADFHLKHTFVVRFSTAVADVDIFDPEIESWTVHSWGSYRIFFMFSRASGLTIHAKDLEDTVISRRDNAIISHWQNTTIMKMSMYVQPLSPPGYTSSTAEQGLSRNYFCPSVNGRMPVVRLDHSYNLFHIQITISLFVTLKIYFYIYLLCSE